MASTVTASTATITISENIVLNGVSYGNSIDKSFDSQGEVIQRIMSIATLTEETPFTDIFHTSTADGRGTIVAADWCYFRITNLDDTNFITLRLYDGTDSQFFKLEAGESFFLMSPDIDVDASGKTFNNFADITQIAANADTAACDVEVLMITE
tara:strand:+ start:3132 stop:3593 length:462 start_codon:yes stop_codon:yes gene_type:complete